MKIPLYRGDCSQRRLLEYLNKLLKKWSDDIMIEHPMISSSWTPPFMSTQCLVLKTQKSKDTQIEGEGKQNQRGIYFLGEFLSKAVHYQERWGVNI